MCLSLTLAMAFLQKIPRDKKNPSTISQEATFNSASLYQQRDHWRVQPIVRRQWRHQWMAPYGRCRPMILKHRAAIVRRTAVASACMAPIKRTVNCEGGFNQLYSGIERANICIDGIRNSPLIADGSASKQIMGQYSGRSAGLGVLWFLFYFGEELG